jgi:predicted TIM-barrel fold metal-dependent hydrolase
MNRRQFLKRAGFISLAGAGLAGWSLWPEAGVINPCRSGLPPELAGHELMRVVWAGVNPANVWDAHAHLVGVGDGGSGAWANPGMDSLWNPFQYIQKLFYLNAGCVHNAPGRVDASFVARLENLMDGFPPGAKILLLAFDWAHDEQGRPQREHSAFHLPNAYAARVAAAHPERMAWAASIHPYRSDAIDALDAAVAAGARAVKWLPAAMGIDPAASRCDGFYRALARHDLPLITHAGHELAVAGKARQDYGNPLKLRRPMEQGVRVVVAHCASHGEDIDLDRGANGPSRSGFELFARLMDEPRHEGRLFADVSAVTQFNRADALETLLARPDWHGRLLNGSDYPLPGILPLISLDLLVARGLLPTRAEPFLNDLREHNPLLFDFALKRLLRRDGKGFAASVFETRAFFDRKPR